jgi:P-type Cu2+ transporter
MVRELRDLGIAVVMLTGDNSATARRIAAGMGIDLMLRAEIAALPMSGSSFLVAVNSLLLKRLRLPEPSGPALTSTVVAEPS